MKVLECKGVRQGARAQGHRSMKVQEHEHEHVRVQEHKGLRPQEHERTKEQGLNAQEHNIMRA